MKCKFHTNRTSYKNLMLLVVFSRPSVPDCFSFVHSHIQPRDDVNEQFTVNFFLTLYRSIPIQLHWNEARAADPDYMMCKVHIGADG